MKLQRKQTIALVPLIMVLSQQVHGFYPQYGRRQAAAHPRHSHRRRYRAPARRAVYEQYDGRRQGNGKEMVRDLGDQIELYIPCRNRNCNNYDVQLKDHRSAHFGTKKIVVTGRQQQRDDWYGGGKYFSGRQRPRRHNWGRQDAPFYENEWLVPGNVVEEAITRTTTRDGYLKITFPRRGADADEAPPHDYHEGGGAEESEPPSRRPNEAAAAESAGGAPPCVGDQEPCAKAATSPGVNARPEPWKPSPRVLEEEEKWAYPADPGIEIEDVDDSCVDEPEYDVKGKTPASIGYWSREKFVFY